MQLAAACSSTVLGCWFTWSPWNHGLLLFTRKQAQTCPQGTQLLLSLSSIYSLQKTWGQMTHGLGNHILPNISYFCSISQVLQILERINLKRNPWFVQWTAQVNLWNVKTRQGTWGRMAHVVPLSGPASSLLWAPRVSTAPHLSTTASSPGMGRCALTHCLWLCHIYNFVMI